PEARGAWRNGPKGAPTPPSRTARGHPAHRRGTHPPDPRQTRLEESPDDHRGVLAVPAHHRGVPNGGTRAPTSAESGVQVSPIQTTNLCFGHESRRTRLRNCRPRVERYHYPSSWSGFPQLEQVSGGGDFGEWRRQRSANSTRSGSRAWRRGSRSSSPSASGWSAGSTSPSTASGALASATTWRGCDGLGAPMPLPFADASGGGISNDGNLT